MRVLRPDNSPDDLTSRSIFLAGPTPRSNTVASWRPEAIAELDGAGFDGDVLAPEPFGGDFERQVAWEFQALENCRTICFWVPRDLKTLPGFTTNVEFGRYLASGRILYGRPAGAPKTAYLDWLYRQVCGRVPYEELYVMLRSAIDLTGGATHHIDLR